jgi:hypothetical protein
LLERPEVPPSVDFVPKTFVEMRQNARSWLARKSKRLVRERQMSAELEDAHGSGARGVVVMPWAEVASDE